MRFEMTVTLGNMLQVGITVVMVVLAFARLRERLVELETMIRPIWNHWNQRGRINRRVEDDDA